MLSAKSQEIIAEYQTHNLYSLLCLPASAVMHQQHNHTHLHKIYNDAVAHFDAKH